MPTLDGEALTNFMRLSNNPLRSGDATIDFGLTQAGRVDIEVFDVTGRKVRSLAAPHLPGGRLTAWSGTARTMAAPSVAARRVYFTRVRYRSASTPSSDTRKLTVLR